MRELKLQLFNFIDDVIAYKKSLKEELEESARALDDFFLDIFMDQDWFVNYSSRIKEDGSLKEKIVRQGLYSQGETPEEVFDQLSDIIGCRVECHFINDEKEVYRALFAHFPLKGEDQYYQAKKDPRIELRLGDKQPKNQKNGVKSYRLDGRFRGDHTLNFELQIKSIVNVFWNEIDHKILYKNYNYLVTEKFVREIMESIRFNLINIDSQLEMVYDHLTGLDTLDISSTNTQLQTLVGNIIQNVYVIPIREKRKLVFDFRDQTDLITEFLFTRVTYESREGMATEFIRILDEANRAKINLEDIGYTILLDPPIHFHSKVTALLGEGLEKAMNEDLTWNLLVHILFDLNPSQERSEVYRTFIDYLYFRINQAISQVFETTSAHLEKEENFIDQLAYAYIKYVLRKAMAKNFTLDGMEELKRSIREGLEAWEGLNQNEDFFAGCFPKIMAGLSRDPNVRTGGRGPNQWNEVEEGEDFAEDSNEKIEIDRIKIERKEDGNLF